VRARMSVLLVFVLALQLLVVPSVGASPADRWAGPYFGDGNIPPGCLTELHISDCFHMRTGLNALDTPKIDVLVVVPVSPFAERDARIHTQAVEVWADGIENLARQMGLDWLADALEFRIAVNHIDLFTGEGTEDFSTYPLWDPEIIVISSNPVGGIGIGIDPLDFSSQLLEIFGIEDAGEGPCHDIQNPFDFSEWAALPGFDDHHGENTGTYYEEDCDGAGGNVCFAVNGAIDPTPGEDVDYDNPAVNLPFGLFNLVAHEVGHCLTLGHVGDALDHTSKNVPTYDIMAYTDDPVGMTKCVSTLNVEVFATRMSQYIDTTGDGAIGEDNLLLANDQAGDGTTPFHVQHPDDHWYASPTGSPYDCPQPDQGLVPGDRTDFDPEPARATPALSVTAPSDGPIDSSDVTVTGTVQRLLEDLAWPASSEEPAETAVAAASTGAEPEEHTFQGTFLQAESTGGAHAETVHVHTLEITEPTTVEVRLEVDPDSIQIMGGSTMDLYITGAAEGSSADLLSSDHRLVFEDVLGTLEMTVDPYLITDPVVGYILTVTVGYAFPDVDDPSGYVTDETVTLSLDGEELGSQPVRTRRGEVATFAIPATLDDGTHTLLVEWTDRLGVVASETVTVTLGDPAASGPPAAPGTPAASGTPAVAHTPAASRARAASATPAAAQLPATGGGGTTPLALLLIASAMFAWRNRVPA
jgi:hypothetical protein